MTLSHALSQMAALNRTPIGPQASCNDTVLNACRAFSPPFVLNNPSFDHCLKRLRMQKILTLDAQVVHAANEAEPSLLAPGDAIPSCYGTSSNSYLFIPP